MTSLIFPYHFIFRWNNLYLTIRRLSMGYKGLSPNQKNYYVYLAFFMGEAGELYLKVGKTGSLKTRFIDLQKANPTTLYKAYVINVGDIDEVADGMEYIFKRRLSPLNIHGEWFHVCYQTLGTAPLPFLE